MVKHRSAKKADVTALQSGSATSRLLRYWPLLVVWIGLSIYLVYCSPYAWIPHDEGVLGHSAERVLNGELPHRDFADTYTGGLAWIHAQAFRLFGVNLYSMRIVLLTLAVATFPFLVAILLRSMPMWAALLVACTAYIWTVPNYFAPLPTWYGLFLTIIATWSTIRFTETNKLVWLALAGVLAGFSITLKITGLYFVAAIFLYLIFLSQESTGDSADRDLTQRRRGTWLSLLVYSALTIFAAAVILTIRNRLTFMDVLVFVGPCIAAASFIAYRETLTFETARRHRWQHLLATFGVFTTSCAFPVIVFLVPYASTGGLEQLYQGLLVLPSKRFAFATDGLPPPWTLLTMIPFVCVIFFSGRESSMVKSLGFVIAIAVVSALFIYIAQQPIIYILFWYTTQPMAVVAVLGVCWALLNPERFQSIRPTHRQLLVLLMCVAATSNLLQFPYSFPLYFCYVAPLIFTLAATLIAVRREACHGLALCFLVVYLGFSFLWVNRGYIRTMGFTFFPVGETRELDSQRASLYVPVIEANYYHSIVGEINRRSSPNEAIYVAGDAPEFYFLSHRRNPTPTFYDFFEADFQGDPTDRANRIAKLLDDHQVRVVVLRWDGEFSGKPSPQFVDVIESKFPRKQHFWFYPERAGYEEPTLTVFWRETAEIAAAKE